MNQAELLLDLRSNLNEPKPGFWSDAILKRHINKAMSKVNSYISSLQDDYFTTSATFQTVAGTKSYPTPVAFRGMRRMEHFSISDPNDITEIEPIGFPGTERGGMWPFPSNGKPLRYLIRAQQFDLFPTPDTAYNIRVYFDQLLLELSIPTDIPSTPEEFHDMISTWATVLALPGNHEDPSEYVGLYKIREQDLMHWLWARRGSTSEPVLGYMEGEG